MCSGRGQNAHARVISGYGELARKRLTTPHTGSTLSATSSAPEGIVSPETLLTYVRMNSDALASRTEDRVEASFPCSLLALSLLRCELARRSGSSVCEPRSFDPGASSRAGAGKQPFNQNIQRDGSSGQRTDSRLAHAALPAIQCTAHRLVPAHADHSEFSGWRFWEGGYHSRAECEFVGGDESEIFRNERRTSLPTAFAALQYPSEPRVVADEQAIVGRAVAPAAATNHQFRQKRVLRTDGATSRSP